ncbi:GNAT family N-acetyltransferase [Aspergillus affinis]|uniref:GNAT family N-acetyltransferase n=1 Tax=Aspergillus affinis TaxID=1070780 RepID=UPI0022FED6E8|nr:putative GNAT family N-acetyltransferase [Aspergillus affinis]KAI9040532.1 putative GNAT family N-acetyltransferase [Aspergillus affinis]
MPSYQNGGGANDMGFKLGPVHADSRDISAVAQTISLSFSRDPLIRWLRPHAPPWTRFQPDTYRWQYRRVQRAIVDGMVFRSLSVTHLAELVPLRDQKSKQSEIVSEHITDEGTDAEAAVLLVPPKKRLRWTVTRVLYAIKLWILDKLSPVPDNGGDEKRLEQMIRGHDQALDNVRTKYQIDDLWYLEVVAVHPSLQGRGLGSKVMNWLLDYTEGQPIVLECTAERNVWFYESLGFKVVEEIDLVDNGDTVKCWVMLRQATPRQGEN